MDLVQVLAVVAQAILLALSAWWARGTVQEARAARREEAERFERELGEERVHRRREAEKARTSDLERRLDRVLDRVAAIDELRMLATSDKKGLDALNEIGPAKRRLRAAIAGVPLDLPQTGHLLHDHPPFPPQAQVDASLTELERNLRGLAKAAAESSHPLPFDAA